MGGRESVLSQRARADRAECLSACRRRAGHDRCSPALGPQVEQRGARGSGDQTDRDTLQRAGGEQQLEAVRDQEHAARSRTRGQTCEHHQPPTHLIG